MARAKLELILPVIQVVVAGGLLILGSRQVPTVMQDDPPFVPVPRVSNDNGRRVARNYPRVGTQRQEKEQQRPSQ